jgi:hypothetical protein
LVLAASSAQRAQQPSAPAARHTAAPQFKVDPFWPKPLPNRWSMQQVTGIFVDQHDHIWFVNRAAAADGDEIGGDGNPPRIDCCVRGPEIIELDQGGSVVNAWGGPGYITQWPTALQTVIVDKQGFVWVAGTAAQDSILKFTKDGKLVWAWKKNTPPLKPQEQQELITAGKMTWEDSPFRLQDADGGKPILLSNCSCFWNEFRHHYIMIASEVFGATMLGEVWYSEADRPEGRSKPVEKPSGQGATSALTIVFAF